MRQLFTSVTQEELQTGQGWAYSAASQPCASPQGTVHHYNHCPSLSMKGHRGWQATGRLLLRSLNSKCLGQTWRRGNGENQLNFPSTHRRPRSCTLPVHRQDYNTDAVMKLHSCWHSFNLISVADITSVWKKESRNELSWLSHISLHVLPGQFTFTADVILLIERAAGCVGFSVNFDKAKGFKFLFIVTEHKLAC